MSLFFWPWQISFILKSTTNLTVTHTNTYRWPIINTQTTTQNNSIMWLQKWLQKLSSDRPPNYKPAERKMAAIKWRHGCYLQLIPYVKSCPTGSQRLYHRPSHEALGLGQHFTDNEESLVCHRILSCDSNHTEIKSLKTPHGLVQELRLQIPRCFVLSTSGFYQNLRGQFSSIKFSNPNFIILCEGDEYKMF